MYPTISYEKIAYDFIGGYWQKTSYDFDHFFDHFFLRIYGIYEALGIYVLYYINYLHLIQLI